MEGQPFPRLGLVAATLKQVKTLGNMARDWSAVIKPSPLTFEFSLSDLGVQHH
jgi:hypothetical protein